MTNTALPNLDAIRDAHAHLAPILRLTPCVRSGFFSRHAGRDVWIKYENRQKTGAFKLRGAANTVRQLADEERARGVIATSAGNHAQGVALAARSHGAAATIVMPEATPLTKISATLGYGAEVVLYGNNYDEAYAHTLELVEERGYTFIHPFNDPRVIAGQGTLGLEVLAQCPEVETIVVPIGGGGLIAGIALAVKALRPDVKIIGVEPEGAAGMKRSMEHGRLETLERVDTIADGIAVRRPGELAFEVVQKYVDDIVLVSDQEIAAALMRFLERCKSLAEPAGAAALAALSNGRIPGGKGCTVAMVCGGNIDLTLLSRIIDRGMQQAGRLGRLRVRMMDKPGSLLLLADTIAKCGANVLHIHHDRNHLDIGYNEARVDLTIQTRDWEHLQEVVQGLQGAGFPVEFVSGEENE